MRFSEFILVAECLIINSFLITTHGVGLVADTENEFYDTDQGPPLQSIIDHVSKLSAQVSKLQNDEDSLKSEMRRIQRESEIKEQQIVEMMNQLNGLTDENQNLHRLLEKIMSAKNQSADYRREVREYLYDIGGVTYIRWGRTTCEEPAYSLYTGNAASGAAYPPSTSVGGSSDIICLSSPEYASMLTGGYSFLYGIEYDFDNLPFSTINNGGAKLKYGNMPCALCHISTSLHQFMLPGRTTCPDGWVREYWGYLVSSHSGQQKSSIICVDEAPERVPGTSSPSNGGLVQPVEARCATLPCQPFMSDYELTCTVCSK